MITEDYVSFETAKLLKEKGFCEECVGRYSVRTKEFHTDTTKKYNNGGNFMYAAPTLQMAMKWLREVHNKHCIIDYKWDLKWCYEVIDLVDTDDWSEPKKHKGGYNFKSYEQAAEVAIKYCLENLINV
jgi:hypothetical protein